MHEEVDDNGRQWKECLFIPMLNFLSKSIFFIFFFYVVRASVLASVLSFFQTESKCFFSEPSSTALDSSSPSPKKLSFSFPFMPSPDSIERS